MACKFYVLVIVEGVLRIYVGAAAPPPAEYSQGTAHILLMDNLELAGVILTAVTTNRSRYHIYIYTRYVRALHAMPCTFSKEFASGHTYVGFLHCM